MLNFNQDFLDMLKCLADEDVKCVVVGAYAMAYHGYVRATGDVDIFVEPSLENGKKILAALKTFGAPHSEVTAEYFSKSGNCFQIGLPPLRIDLLNAIEGVAFDEVYLTSIVSSEAGVAYRIASLEKLIKNKETNPREKDRIDAIELRKFLGTSKKKT